MRTGLLAFLAAVLVCAFAPPVQAANLIVNGDFELLTMTNSNSTHSTIIGGGGIVDYANRPLPTSTGWRSSDAGGFGPGYNFIMVDNPDYLGGLPDRQSLTGADDLFDGAYTSASSGDSRFSLWGPDTFGGGAANGMTNSPTGGSFLAADGSYLNRPVEQTLVGLEVGKTYALTFWWAAAQQSGLLGATKEAWIVCIGTCAYNTAPLAEGLAYFEADPGNTDIANPVANELVYNPADTSLIFKTDVVSNPEKGFTPWKYEYFTFTATSETTTLSLLAYGTPLGQPPFSLIDGLTINSDGVPEPSTWAMMLIGFGVIGGVMRTRRRPMTDHRAHNAQII